MVNYLAELVNIWLKYKPKVDIVSLVAARYAENIEEHIQDPEVLEEMKTLIDKYKKGDD